MCPNFGGSCDAMVLGSFLRGLSAAGLWPCPDLPYESQSIFNVSSQLANLRMSSLCERVDIYKEGIHVMKSCTFKVFRGKFLQNVQDAVSEAKEGSSIVR